MITIRHAFLALRKAVAKDFTTVDNKPLFGAIYFCMNSKGNIENKINYLQPEIDLQTFKTLFDNGQIFVFENPNEVINIDEQTIVEYNEVIATPVKEIN